MKVNCIRCGRKFRGIRMCFDCELFIRRQVLPGVKPEALRKAKDYVINGGLSRTKNPRVFASRSKSITRYYKTWSRGCTCPSGIYRGLRGASCYHSYAAQLLNTKRKR